MAAIDGSSREASVIAAVSWVSSWFSMAATVVSLWVADDDGGRGSMGKFLFPSSTINTL